MARVIVCFITVVMGLVFTITPRGPQVQWFPLSDQVYYVESYFYHLWQAASFVVFANIINVESARYKVFFQAFFWFWVIDLIDYLLTCNNPWMPGIGPVEVSWNTIGVILLGIFGIIAIWRQYKYDTSNK